MNSIELSWWKFNVSYNIVLISRLRNHQENDPFSVKIRCKSPDTTKPNPVETKMKDTKRSQLIKLLIHSYTELTCHMMKSCVWSWCYFIYNIMSYQNVLYNYLLETRKVRCFIILSTSTSMIMTFHLITELILIMVSQIINCPFFLSPN